MLRRLLACLALLTGLTAAGAPAQAEMTHSLAHIEASASRASTAQGQAAVAIARPATAPSYGTPRLVRPLADRAAAAPAVRIGSDRARE